MEIEVGSSASISAWEESGNFEKLITYFASQATLVHESAVTQDDLLKVEEHLKKSLAFYERLHSKAHPGDEKQGDETQNAANGLPCEDRLQSRLMLLLFQEGRKEEAKRMLARSGYLYHLSSNLFHYPLKSSNIPSEQYKSYVRIKDNVLPPSLLAHMRLCFGSASHYWSDHHYRHDQSDYFSYTHRLKDATSDSAIDQLLRHVQSVVGASLFPEVYEAEYAEWWAHCRPYNAGHQFHFDTDNEGFDGVRNPIVSCVVVIEGDIGGPTLITTQKTHDTILAEKGWLVFPKENRLVVFKGDLLHAVVPGRSYTVDPSKRRTTFMIAYWKQISIRPNAKPGPSRPFPAQDGELKWPILLKQSVDLSATPLISSDEVVPIEVGPIWEDVNAKVNLLRGCAAKSLKSLPAYDLCFQGF